jgi:glycosyltransferase involved in cell wall biosynthesis
MIVGIDIDHLRNPDRSGLYRLIWGLIAGVRDAGLTRQTRLFVTNSSSYARLRPDVARALDDFRIHEFHNPRVFWRLRMRMGVYGRCDVFQTITSTSFPPVPGRLDAFLVPDLTVVHHPEHHTEGNRRYWNGVFQIIQKHASLVTTYSSHARQDVIRTLGIPPEKVVVSYLGCDAEYRPVPPETAAPTLANLGLEYGKYILTVGTIEPRKNHVTLLRAYATLKARGRVAGVPLVVVGSKGWGYEPVLAEIDRLGLTGDVRVFGFVESLAGMYSGAGVMVYPSLYEGFGLPPLEAMACGCPVVTSNATSLPEVVGDAGLMVEPTDHVALAERIDQVLSDPALRGRLSAAGVRRAAGFTWRKYAEGLFGAYRQSLRQRSA